jgi:hypothetical protein
MDVALANTILTQAGAAAMYLYLAQAKCVGLTQPRPYPAVTKVIPGEGFKCGTASPTGYCAGLHTSRTITLSYMTTDAWPHELFHAVLCQLPAKRNPYGCDPDHASPLWQQCMIPSDAAHAP